MLQPRCEPILGRHSVYAALDVEERVDAGNGLKRDGRYLVGRFALAHVAGDVSEFEEFAPRVAPAKCADHQRGAAVGTIEVVVAAIGIGLQGAVPSGEMRVGVGLLAIGREVEECGGRRAARERAVIADVSPEPRLLCCSPGQKRHGGVVTMQPLGGQNMGTDQVMDRLQGRRAGSDLIGQCGETESDAFPGVALSLAVQWLMLAELQQDRRQQVRSCPSPHVAWKGAGGWLIFSQSRQVNFSRTVWILPLARNDLQRLGDVFAHLHDAVRAAAGAGRRGIDDQALARQVLGKRLAGRPAAFESGDICDSRRHAFRSDLVFGGVGFKFFELQFHLLDQPGAALRALAVLLATYLGDLELEMPDHRLRRRHDRAHLCEVGLGRGGTRFRCRKRGAQSGYLRSSIIHGRKLPCRMPKAQQKQRNAGGQPAFEGRCVQRGLRQSIPSRR